MFSVLSGHEHKILSHSPHWLNRRQGVKQIAQVHLRDKQADYVAHWGVDGALVILWLLDKTYCNLITKFSTVSGGIYVLSQFSKDLLCNLQGLSQKYQQQV